MTKDYCPVDLNGPWQFDIALSLLLYSASPTTIPMRTGIAQGNEGVDVKEGSENTVIEYNEIYLQLDHNSGGKRTGSFPRLVTLPGAQCRLCSAVRAEDMTRVPLRVKCSAA